MRNTDRLLSRTRSTQLSPQIVATVDTRMSISRPSTGHRDLPVLRSAPLDDVHLGHDLEPAHERRRHAGWELDGVVQRTVDAEPDPQLLALGLDVDVRGPVAHRLGDEQVDDLDDRRVGGVDGLHRGVGETLRAVGGLLEGSHVLPDVAEGPVGGVDGALDV